ncbi:MAG TPA: TetR/AcrR family transcriptional regulator [Terracidiphilus sp.]|nr:TetR/AcrR family transcriptional regulator [Terracidiphilus sp.]
MSETTREALDPRVRRTRQMLQCALAKLLKEKEFDQISVQDIADAATLNRATFYDHYDDKFALLECLVGSRFNELLEQRGVRFDGSCSSGLKATVLGVCDFLLEWQRQMEPHLESAVIAVVRRMILEGAKRHAGQGGVSPELIASTVSGAILGAAKEWVGTSNRCSSDEIVETVIKLVTPIFGAVNSAAMLET